MIYVREAHATDGDWPMKRNDQPVVETPLTLEERMDVARRACGALELAAIPMVVDKLDDKVEYAYSAAPDRLYLVDAKGKLAYVGGPGPFGFKPDELDAAIEKLLKGSKSKKR